jgi:predicted 3-demethylubiquinone-9 3-methyltransferase (glyoxalase superfamily)
MQENQETSMPKISPFLWFDGNMEQAVNFYASVFKDARIVSMNPMSATFELLGQRFIALNAGPHHKFNEAVSFFIHCSDQTEVDYYWSKLTAGGAEQPCGWVKDPFGLSWQVIPDALGQLLSDPDRAKAQRVMQAMLKMKKIVIADLHAAAAG